MAWSELSNAEKIVRIMSAILSVVFIIVLILIKLANPEFKLGLMVFIIFIIVAFFFGVVVVFHYLQKKDRGSKKDQVASDEKLPPAITLEQARELAMKQLLNPLYADYFRGEVKETNELLGEKVKSWVYSITGNTVYSKQKYTIVMNRHFPNQTMNILPNPKPEEVARAKRLAAKSPESEPDVEETTTTNPLTGTSITTKKVSHKKEDDKKKEDDL